MEFTYNDNLYTYIPFHELDSDDLPIKKEYKQSKYLDIGCAFDIETSKIGDEKLSTMYVWQFGINDITIIGRTWDEFRQLLSMLYDKYKPDNKHRLLVFVHNLSFEFSFIKGQLKWLEEKKQPSIFATEERRIIKATTNQYIEFRDSAILTQMSLDKVAKNYNLGIEKLKGDLDYNLPRHYLTPLSNEELAYCINDVQILTRFYHQYIKKEFVRKQHNIPLTSTGIVRDELKRAYKKVNKKLKVKYKRFIKQSFPNYDDYVRMIQWLYRGGFTHANASLTDEIFDVFESGINIGARDIKSSYPSSLLHFKYPNKFIDKPVEWFYRYGFDYKFINDYAYYGTFIFKGIKAKTQHSIESRNKLMEFSDCVFDNGRLIGGDNAEIKVMLNEIDMLNYNDFYEWDEVICLDFHISHKEELPHFIKDIILQYYYYKETEKDKYLRTLIKYKLNAVYGMMVSGLLHNNYVYNPETKTFDNLPPTKSYEQIISKEILLPQWGIWCTSYSRRAVLYGMKKVGYDAIYSDTDSCKILDADAYTWVFDTYNDRMRRINKTMYVGKFDREVFSELGCFEDETIDTGRIIKFKTLGAKRYIYTSLKNGKKCDNVTVAGMRKGSLQMYCEKYELDIYDTFKHNLFLSSDDADKLTTSYEDAAFEREFTDYKGVTTTINEESCVTLYNIPFNMILTKDYIELLATIHQLNDKRVIKRRY